MTRAAYGDAGVMSRVFVADVFARNIFGRAATGSAQSHWNSVGRRPLRNGNTEAVQSRIPTRHLWQSRRAE